MNLNQKQKFMDILAFKLPPFDRFVSKSDIPEWDEAFFSRSKIIKNLVSQLTSATTSKIIPVIGNVGSGKTHFLWGIKNNIDIKLFTSFMDLPRSKDKFFYYIYSSFIEDFGVNNLRDFTNEFGSKYGASERLYGLFRTRDNDKIETNAYNALKNDFINKDALEQIIRVLIQHFMSPDKLDLTERWLLGELMDFNELSRLNVEQDLSGEGMAETMLKLLIENYSSGMLFLFDDFDKALNEYSKLENGFGYDNDDEVNWAEDLELLNDPKEEKVNKSLISKILELLTNSTKFKLIISMELSESDLILTELKKGIKYYSDSGKNLINLSDPIYLREISIDDTFNLYFSRIKNFCRENKLSHPAADYNFDFKLNYLDFFRRYGDDLFFPLTQKIITHIYVTSEGNTRKILKNFKKIFDALIFEELNIDKIENEFTNFISSY